MAWWHSTLLCWPEWSLVQEHAETASWWERARGRAAVAIGRGPMAPMSPPPPAVVRRCPCSGASPTSPPLGPGKRGLHHHRVHRGGHHGVRPVEGFSVPGGPAVLWGHPLPGGVVSTTGRGACAPHEAGLSNPAAGPTIPKLGVSGHLCKTHRFLGPRPFGSSRDPGFWVLSGSPGVLMELSGSMAGFSAAWHRESRGGGLNSSK